MKSSNKKKKLSMDDVDKVLEKTDFSNVSTKHAVKMTDIYEEREKRGRPSVGKRRSIILPDALVERLIEVAEKLNIGGYQPLIRLILSEKIEEYEKKPKRKKVG